ncbi:hypothetical protein RJ639_041559 [Escallonia herrerae]|uniref:non-specific serine/threonine protein kinase n=1 Tax=Escallonia herrerae TaxID=1293975 RepID=A0AA88WHQ7_9ASTE|nr:hypothetical protein RJ639_041559 [Escallonia herrerae]
MELLLATTAFNKLVCLLLFVPLVLDCFSGFGSVAQLLPEEEESINQLKGLNLTGVLPAEFANLTYLREIDLSRNYINGSIPTTFGQLRITTLSLVANRISGSIPKEIGDIATLEELRIDGNTLSGKIPDFIGNWTKLDRLILRNCLIVDLIPGYIGEIASLKTLDLSFNRLTGPIPDIQSEDLDYLEVNFEGHEYEEDLTTTGPSYFLANSERWAYSSTGLFMGKDDANYIAPSTSNATGADFYGTARLAPTSVKYYGLCMRKGSYRVRLHFAEIMYSDDMTFSSLGRRIFDVSIQGDVVLKDFNIEKEANGVGKGITKDFNNVLVNGSTLEIHLYWAGKGTTAIPDRGVYGPLISAITVTPNFNVDKGKLSVGAVIGIVIASFVVLALILYVLRIKGYLGGENIEDKGGGYMAPEYAMRGYLTDKADVYSFGVVALEIVSGKSNTNYKPKEEFVYLLDWAYVLQEQGNLLELVDPRLGSNYNEKEAMRMLNLALLCTNPSPTLRPSMSSVVSMLQGKIPVQAPLVKRRSMDEDLRFKAFERLTQDSQTQLSTYSQDRQAERSMSRDGPWIDSSFSIQSKDELADSSSTKHLLLDLDDVNLK